MIQRIQSVFLFLAAILLLVPFVLPYATLTGPFGELVYTLAGGSFKGSAAGIPMAGKLGPQLLPFGLTGLAFIGLIACIFLYKNRKNQIILAYLLFALQLGITLSMRFSVSFAPLTVPGGTMDDTAPFVFEIGRSLGIFFPIAGSFLTLLAIMRIRKDEQLVRSANRIR